MMVSNQRQMHSDSGGYIPPQAMNEINVTPMVDVMLVLLIIFMVSAPLMQQGVQVDVPKTDSMPLSEQEEQIVLVVTRDGSIQINENKIPLKVLSGKLRAIFKGRKNKEIFIQADRNVPYGTVATVMSTVQLAGISRIGMVTQPKDAK